MVLVFFGFRRTNHREIRQIFSGGFLVVPPLPIGYEALGAQAGEAIRWLTNQILSTRVMTEWEGV
jgi:hypothetical protein